MNRTPSFFDRAVPFAWLAAMLLTCLLGVASPTAAAAAGPSGDRRTAAKAEVQKAQVHYKLGRFDQALEAYARAYELFNAPALLFNMGQCHKNLKNYDRAIFFFEGYLREETRSDPRKRTLAEELIAESHAEIEKQRNADEEARRAAAATDRPPAATSSVAAVFGPPPSPAPAATVLVDEPGDGATVKRPLTHKWWFWTVVGAGALAIAGGALAYYFSGPTATVLPAGSVGTLDGR